MATPATKISGEVVATARKLLDRRAALEREQARASEQPENGSAEYTAGIMAGVNDALAMLWAGVLEQAET